MTTAAFVLLAALLAAYVVLDGYDLGIGILHLFYARGLTERAVSFELIGPFARGNEVMLVITGAALFALFPRAYATAFSGFYLPFILVLWLLIGRGMSLELRDQYQNPLWQAFMDAAFAASSALLALFFGLAIGNIVRGVPLDAHGYFAGTFGMLLNWFSVSVALLAVVLTALHGAAFACWRLEGRLYARALAAFRGLWIAALVLLITVTAQVFFVQRIHGNFMLFALPPLGALAFAASRIARTDALRFACSSLFVALLVGTAAATIYPFLLPAFPAGTNAGLSIENGGGNQASMVIGFTAAVIGVGAGAVYATVAARGMLHRISE